MGLTGDGPAFPTMREYEKFDDDRGKYVEYHLPEGGMSLRDYFAAKAMQSVILAAMTNHDVAAAFNAESRDTHKTVSKIAFVFADAMLKAREEKR